MQEGAGIRQMIDDELRELGLRLRDLNVKLELGLQESARGAVLGGYGSTFIPQDFTVEDDHLPFVAAGVQSIDIIDLDYPQWHTAQDDLDHVSARSLQIVGDVVLDALPQIEAAASSR